eukprot:7361902-Pyramimonas_sp.AAC.1
MKRYHAERCKRARRKLARTPDGRAEAYPTLRASRREQKDPTCFIQDRGIGRPEILPSRRESH